MIRISVDGRYTELSTQRRVLVEQWSQSRCFATTITLANNVKLENVSKMLGHTNTRMTLHYAHIMNESLAQEMNKVAAIMGGIICTDEI